VKELVELDAVELTWSCLDDLDSQPTIYVVQSTSTTGHRDATQRHLQSTDAADSAAWRVVAEVSLKFTRITISLIVINGFTGTVVSRNDCVCFVNRLRRVQPWSTAYVRHRIITFACLLSTGHAVSASRLPVARSFSLEVI